jgi:hypothetical protein
MFNRKPLMGDYKEIYLTYSCNNKIRIETCISNKMNMDTTLAPPHFGRDITEYLNLNYQRRWIG